MFEMPSTSVTGHETILHRIRYRSRGEFLRVAFAEAPLAVCSQVCFWRCDMICLGLVFRGLRPYLSGHIVSEEARCGRNVTSVVLIAGPKESGLC